MKVEVILGEALKYFMDNLVMGLKVSGPDENIIKIDCNLVFSDEICKDVIHQSLECSWAVTEPKVHNTGFKESTINDKGSFPFVTFLNPDVVVASSDIKLSENVCTFKLSDNIKGEWQRVAVLDCDIVEFSVVLNEVEFAVLFLNEEDGQSDWGLAFYNVSLNKSVYKELFQFSIFDGGYGINFRL